MSTSKKMVLFAALLLAVDGFLVGPRSPMVSRSVRGAARVQEEGEEEVASKRRSRFYRLEAEVSALEEREGGNTTGVAAKLQVLSSRESLGAAAREKVAKLERRVAAVEPGVEDARQKQSTKARKPRVGDVVTGRCVETRPFGAMIALDNQPNVKPALLHISEISSARVASVDAVIPVGSSVTCVVAGIDAARRISLSTKRLEAVPGSVLRDAQAVFANASAAASLAPRPPAPRPDPISVASTAAQLADSTSLEELDLLVEKMARRKASKGQRRAVESEPALVDSPPGDALSIAAAFQPNPEARVRQRDQEFELLMRDVIYEPSSSLTDVSKLIRGRGKRGAFTSPFWTKIFKRDAPIAPPPRGAGDRPDTPPP